MRALALFLTLFAATAAHADPTIELYEIQSSDAVEGGALSAGLEFSETHPGPNFVVSVDFRGVSNASRTTRFFLVSGAISFNRGQYYADPSLVGDVPYMDVQIVPVSNLMSQRLDRHSRSHTAMRWMPTQVHRDIKVADMLSVSVHAWGIAREAEAPIWETNPRIKSFIRAAVDVIGYRFMLRGISDGLARPEDHPTQGLHGLQLGSAQAELGAKWDISQAIQLRLSVGAALNGAVLANGGGRLVSEADFFARLEFAVSRAQKSLSLFVQPGARMLLNDPVSGDFATSYSYLQIGIRGTFR